MSLVFVLMVAGLTGLLLLCSLKLQRSFSLLERRTELLLCTKEAEGETLEFVRFIGRTNWAIKNAKKAQLILMFIPGAQGMALKAHKVKKVMKRFQDLRLLSHLKNLASLKRRGCSLDPRSLTTPFELGAGGFRRSWDATAKLRSPRWTYHYVALPYALAVNWDARGFEGIWPVIKRISSESAAKLPSILSSY